MKKLIFIYIMLIASCSVLESKADGVYIGVDVNEEFK